MQRKLSLGYQNDLEGARKAAIYAAIRDQRAYYVYITIKGYRIADSKEGLWQGYYKVKPEGNNVSISEFLRSRGGWKESPMPVPTHEVDQAIIKIDKELSRPRPKVFKSYEEFEAEHPEARAKRLQFKAQKKAEEAQLELFGDIKMKKNRRLSAQMIDFAALKAYPKVELCNVAQFIGMSCPLFLDKVKKKKAEEKREKVIFDRARKRKYAR